VRRFKNKRRARRDGKKGGKAVPAEKRYFSRNKEAAAAAGRKGGMTPRKPAPIPDDAEARALFEKISGDYAKLVPWDELAESTRQFWRRSVNFDMTQ
jgi:general stress protein YciG